MNIGNESLESLVQKIVLETRSNMTYNFIGRMHQCGLSKEKIAEITELPVSNVDCILFVWDCKKKSGDIDEKEKVN